MHIVLDISSLPYGTGVSMYTRELVNAFNRLRTNHRFTLIAGAMKQRNFFENWFRASNLGDNFSLKVIPIPPKLQILVWTKLNWAPIDFWVKDADIFHSLDWSLPIGKVTSVITVHDLFFWKKPDLQQHPFESELKYRIKKANKNGCKAIAVSETTKNDLCELAGYKEELISVIYEAAPNSWEKKNDLQQRLVKEKYKLEDVFLLAVSTLEPRKNYHRLLSAYEKSGVKIPLVISGKIGWGEKIENLPKNVKLLGYLPEDDLIAIWQQAKGFVYPSLYEGFGLPILQSFKLGVPVLTSNIGSMREIAGDATFLINPYDDEEISRGLKLLADLSHKIGNEKIAKGITQQGNFSWEKTAKETLNFYAEAKNLA